MTEPGDRPPTLSVILPVYNSRQFVEQAVASILKQTFTDFELIVVDDGSFDGTAVILKRLSDQDERIILVTRENRGLVASLNEGLTRARGEFIARMDADDAALPQRFAEQLAFLRATGYDICGTAVQCFGNSRLIWRYPQTPTEVEVHMLFDSPYAHPSVMFRASVFKSLLYRDMFSDGEDYDLWQRAWGLGLKGANLNGVFLRYRVHAAQVSSARKYKQYSTADQVRRRHWQAIAGRTYDSDITSLLDLFKGERGDFSSITPLLKRVIAKYQGSAQTIFANHAFRIAVKAAASSRRPWRDWRSVLEGSQLGRSLIEEMILFLVWMLRLGPKNHFYAFAKSWYQKRLQR